MNLKTKAIFATFIVVSFITNNTNAKETSSVTKHCHNGRCFLAHFYKETNGASCYMGGEHYDLNHNTLIITMNKEGDSSITYGAAFERNKELRHYFPTSCSLPNEFYITYVDHSKDSYIIEEGNIKKDSSSVKYITKHTDHEKTFYVLKEKNDEEKRYAPVNCKDFESIIVRYIAQQTK